MTAKITHFANLFLTHIKKNLPLSPLAFQSGAAFVGGLAGITSILFATSIVVDGWKTSAQAQITPAVNDANTIVNQTGNNFNITGGTQAGANLFHSFQKFGLDQGQIANFLSNPSIQNILGRVTGGDASVINGQIKVTGGISNLYLINPAGIVFGQGASLSVPGSFTATTANGIQLDDKLFKALGTNDYASLIGSPNGFAFTQAGGIFNAGNLAVESGQSLTLVGGSVINTGTLSAHNGNITISAVPGEKFVRISESGSLLSYDLPVETKAAINQEPFTPVSLPELLTVGSISVENGFVKVADSPVPISNSSGTVVVSNQVDVSGVTGGSVNIQGDNVSLINANINALGTNGGGEVFIYSGDFGVVKNSNRLQTFVSQDSTINAELVSTGIIPSPDLLPPDYFPNADLTAPGSLPDQPLPPFTTPPISLPDQPLPPVSVTPTTIESPTPPPPIQSPPAPPSLPDRPLPTVVVIAPVPITPPSFPDRSLPIPAIPPSFVDGPLPPQLDKPGVYPSFPDRPVVSPVTEVFTTQPPDSGVSSSNVNLYQFEQVTAQQQANTQTNNSCNVPNNVARATLSTNSKIADRSQTTVSNLVTAERDRCGSLEDDKQILQILGETPDATKSIRILAPTP